MAKIRSSDSLAFLFDLDGTLIDSVYQHVLAWREATQAAGIELPVWRIHRQIGMSGGLMLNALARETGRQVSRKDAERIQVVHAEAFANQAPSLRVLPGAQELLNVPVITRDDVRFAKPDPDLFVAAGKRLKVSMSRCIIVGDSVWDLLAARRAFALSVGLLSGGYGREELERAGAYRVYQDPADLLRHLDEVGVRL